MNKVLSKSNINLLIIPLTDPETEALEDYLFGKVVGTKCDDEFVCVVGSSKFGSFSLVSYGRYDQAEFSEQEKVVLERKIADCGKEWLKANTNYSF